MRQKKTHLFSKDAKVAVHSTAAARENLVKEVQTYLQFLLDSVATLKHSESVVRFDDKYAGGTASDLRKIEKQLQELYGSFYIFASSISTDNRETIINCLGTLKVSVGYANAIENAYARDIPVAKQTFHRKVADMFTGLLGKGNDFVKRITDPQSKQAVRAEVQKATKACEEFIQRNNILDNNIS